MQPLCAGIYNDLLWTFKILKIIFNVFVASKYTQNLEKRASGLHFENHATQFLNCRARLKEHSTAIEFCLLLGRKNVPRLLCSE